MLVGSPAQFAPLIEIITSWRGCFLPLSILLITSSNIHNLRLPTTPPSASRHRSLTPESGGECGALFSSGFLFLVELWVFRWCLAVPTVLRLLGLKMECMEVSVFSDLFGSKSMISPAIWAPGAAKHMDWLSHFEFQRLQQIQWFEMTLQIQNRVQNVLQMWNN